jgi:hypothetical protein
VCIPSCGFRYGIYNSGASWVLFGTPQHPSHHNSLQSGDIILTLNMVKLKSHFSLINCTDIVQVFQSMFPDDMIANKWPLENRSMFFGSLWNPSIFDGINQKKDKKEDIYVLLF